LVLRFSVFFLVPRGILNWPPLTHARAHVKYFIFIFNSPQTVAQQEKKNKESDSLTKSCTTNNDSDKNTHNSTITKFFHKELII